jgi:hypothetical protein
MMDNRKFVFPTLFWHCARIALHECLQFCDFLFALLASSPESSEGHKNT